MKPVSSMTRARIGPCPTKNGDHPHAASRLRPYQSEDWDAFRSLVQDNELMWRLSGALTSEAARDCLHG
jgi:hypothetical protein